MTGEQMSIDDALDDLGRVIPSRSTDPDTSRAAEPVKIKAGTQRAHLLYSFYRFDANGLTDEQAIEPTGETRLGAAGTPRIVSKITDKGRTWIRENR